MPEDAHARDGRNPPSITSGAASPYVVPPWTWKVVIGLTVLAALARVAAGTTLLAPVLDLGWGIFCVAMLGLAAARFRGRGRAAWGLFSASVLCGALSMSLYPWADLAPLGALRDALDLGAYIFGAAGIAMFIRGFGGIDPDAWIDAAAVGLALALLMFEFVFEHSTAGSPNGRGTAFGLVVAAVDAAIFTAVARFVIRPVASPSLSLLGAAIGAVLVVDTAFYAGVGPGRPAYEALWFVGYGAWAAGGLHPDTLLLVAGTRSGRRSIDDDVRGAVTAVAIHGFGALAVLVAFGSHMAKAPTENLVVFVGAFFLQIFLVGTRAMRLIRRLQRDDRRRREAEHALRISEERFRRLAEVAPVGIFVSAVDGHSTFQNEAWSAAAGLPVDAALDWGYADAIHPDDREWAMATWLDSTKTRKPFDIEHRLLRPDGEVRWVHATAAPLLDAAGDPEGWVGTVSDITSLVRARTDALEREAFISGLIEQAPVGVAIYGTDGRVISVNHAQRRIRELAVPGETASADVRDDALIRVLGQGAAIERALAGDAGGDPAPIRIPLPGGGADDPDLWLRITWFPLRDRDGGVAAIISFTEDVTPAARAEVAQRAVEGKLRETAKLEALGVLAGGIAHDFNNLLVAILGHASLARTQLEPDSPVDQDLASVEMAARRAADLARQMLAYSGRGSFVVGPVSIEALLREMGDLLRRSIAKNATLRHEFAPDLPPVLADATQLRQVALNLIVNASDALGDEPGTITLRTGLVTLEEDDPDVVPGIPVTPGTYVLLEVADTGRGMDAATRARVFDPFFTTKATGRGLGLAATLGIVIGHGGALRVRSRVGEGTRFEVLLRPAAAAQPVEPGPAAPTPGTLAASVPGRTGHVLIVDDEPTVRALARRVLERAGYEVDEAADGPEAIEAFALRPDRWSGVLLDLTLPTLDGMAVLAAMRELREDIPAVICSGWAAEEVSERLASAPRTRIVQKPYAPSALVDAFSALADPGSVVGSGSAG